MNSDYKPLDKETWKQVAEFALQDFRLDPENPQRLKTYKGTNTNLPFENCNVFAWLEDICPLVFVVPSVCTKKWRSKEWVIWMLETNRLIEQQRSFQ